MCIIPITTALALVLHVLETSFETGSPIIERIRKRRYIATNVYPTKATIQIATIVK